MHHLKAISVFLCVLGGGKQGDSYEWLLLRRGKGVRPRPDDFVLTVKVPNSLTPQDQS
jgi:hypothetical protein